MGMRLSTCAASRLGAMRAGAAVLLIFAAFCAAGAGTSHAAVPSCPEIAPFAPANFSHPTTINNPLLPLNPGSQLILDGTVVRAGATVPHRVVFTVTDVTKVVNGVRTVVVWDVDREGDLIIEAELAFFAQDDAGNVWNLGEYPEEFVDGVFAGAPSTWIAGLKDAQAGIHMVPAPKIGARNVFFLQGFAPDIEFEDCARVDKLGQRVCVTPSRCFDNVVVTQEKDIFDPAGGLQTKYYAPGVGIVQIGAIGDPQAETLALTDQVQLTGDALAAARAEALKLDDRAYQFSDIYTQTARAEGPPSSAPPPPPPPPPPPAAQPAPAATAVAAVKTTSRLTRATAAGIVRRGLRARLKGWRITRVSCTFIGRGRLRCSFTATRAGLRLRGSGTVTRQTSGRVRYRLTARITRNGCRPAASARCSRRAVWSGARGLSAPATPGRVSR
jgi:hypothetical protein